MAHLAHHWHWSERAILLLPSEKRRAYIEALNEKLQKQRG